MTDEKTTIGARLRSRRVHLDLTLAEVAERAGLSLAYVSNLERGRANPTLEALQGLATALGVSLGAIVGDAVEGDPGKVMLANAPRSLLQFARSTGFVEAVERLAERRSEAPEDVRQRLLTAMASAPRRSSGEPTESDWRRLLDTYFLILQE